ncbi:hypothetical protein BKA62DRAFT_686102 [Auriculariales sp. MPI-PUGE-AT-0066]|nr:hypothetical protein BKA62DRAFT_686102 [Auriculariales sp. MPI-PUGE-AT-0066]
MDPQNQQNQQQPRQAQAHPQAQMYGFYPPDQDGSQDATAHYIAQQHTAYTYLIPHNPVPIVPSHMGMDLSHVGFANMPQQLDPAMHAAIPTPPMESPGFEQHFPHGMGMGGDATANGILGANLSRSASASSAGSRRSLQMGGNSVRYNPIASPALSSRSGGSIRRRSVDDVYGDDDDDLNDPDLNDVMGGNRKESTRRLRIEAEQRRRDDLRDGYAKLRDVLPSKNLKGAKVAVLDRATTYIMQLESEISTMKHRVDSMEDECSRLRNLNEMITMGLSTARLAGQPTVAHPMPANVAPAPVPTPHSNMHAPTAELGHMRLGDSRYTQPRGIDPADIMPAPSAIHYRRDESFSPSTPTSSSEFSP